VQTILEIPDKEFVTSDFAEIKKMLSERGVEFERWEAKRELAIDSTQEQVLEAYAHELTPYMEKKGFQTADVINVHPAVPNVKELRAKFLREHTHSEDEVRFFVDGQGKFWFHFDDGLVMALTCVRGDFLAVPKGYRHWFDLAPEYFVKAIRIFSNQEGWVAHYTESKVDERYNPKDEN
jgi:1,2-dihydroxy-3-keto-5-methylthiopentene dioxygenase